MSSSHPKPTRSRFSSPHPNSSSPAGHTRGGNAGNGGNGNNDGSRSLMQRWLEPPVQNKPSFQDAGLIRGGVVENMAALGTMPKAAMLRKTPVSAESAPPASATAVKRIVLKKPYSAAASVVAAMPATTTPSATATPPETTRASRSESLATTEEAALAKGESMSPISRVALPIPVIDNMDDDDYVDYVPKKTKGRRVSQNPNQTDKSPAIAPAIHSRRQSARHRSVHSSPAPPPRPIDTPDPTPVPTSPASPTQSETPSFDQPGREPDDKELADKIVEIAVDEAIRHFRYPTAWALRLLYDEHSSDPAFVSMIEDIYYQRATPKTIRKFHRLVSEKKKDGKKENKGCYYFVPPSTGSRFTPHKPQPALYGGLIKMEFATLLRESISDVEVETDADGHVRKKRKTELVESNASAKGINQTETQLDTPTTTTATTTATTLSTNKTGKSTKTVTAAINGLHGTSSNPNTPKAVNLSNHAHLPPPRPGGVAKNKSPRGKKTRRGSTSSTSSLSSVPDDVIEGYDDFLGGVDDGDHDGPEASRIEGDQAKGKNGQIPAGSTQPINAGQAKPASKKQIVSPNPASEQTTPTQHPHPRSRDSSMPAATVTTTTTNSVNNGTNSTNGTSRHNNANNTNQPASALKFPSRYGDFDEFTDTLRQKKLAQKSETAVKTKRISEESFVREPLQLDELPEELTLLPHPPAPPPEHVRLSRTPAPALSGRAARAAKRNHDEFDDASSPTASSFRADFEPSSARNSRAATPANLRSSKKTRGGLRVKTSPMKKKGTSAGIPRNGDRPSPIGNGMPNNQDDNDDSCYACGGNGELVCCDGCTFSFHFMCIDPPMDQGHIPDEWFCNECQLRYNPPLENEHHGIFGLLTANLQRKNPRAFRLPESTREYFEGVKTGAEGEYEEIAPPKPKTNKKNVDDSFDFFKVRNGDKAVLCHECHKGATDNRPIIPCSVCGLNWHLECLSPPLAVPPVLRTWRCPCHVDDLLGNLPTRLAPAHKYRKIKNMPVIEQAYSRGLANNGWIEIEEDDSDEDENEAWRGHKGFGRVFRVSAKGIKQDFITKVHENRPTPDLQRAPAPASVAYSALAVASRLPSVEKQQAALNLLQLSQGPGTGIDMLVRAMMSEASPAMVTMVAQGDAQRIAESTLAKADVTSLEALLAQADALRLQITKILEGRTNYGPQEKADTQPKALTPNSISHDDSTVVDELKLDSAGSRDTEKKQDVVTTEPSRDDPAMQVD